MSMDEFADAQRKGREAYAMSPEGIHAAEQLRQMENLEVGLRMILAALKSVLEALR